MKTEAARRRYDDWVYDLYADFETFVRNEGDEEARHRKDYTPRGGLAVEVPAIVTSLSGVELGILWARFCDQHDVHWSELTRLAPTSHDAMGVDRIYYP